jgi:hypothetical protein
LVLAVLAAVTAVAACRNDLLLRISEDVLAARAAHAPSVLATAPAANQEDVATGTTVTAVFASALDPASVTTESFVLARGATQVPGTVSYDAGLMRAIFTPSSELDLLTTYVATLSSDIRNAAGTPMAAEYSWSFTTYAANPTEIVLNVSYTGVYGLGASSALYLRFLPQPLVVSDPGGPLPVHEVEVTAPGSVVVAVSDLPAAQDGRWALQIIHDIDGDYEVTGPSDGDDTEGFYFENGGTNVTFEDADVAPTTASSPIRFVAKALLEPGRAYAMEYADPPTVAADASEPDNDRLGAKAVPGMNLAATRTLTWEDEDWFSFEPPRTDWFRIVVVADPYNPDDVSSLSLGFDAELSVLRLDPGSDSLGSVGYDADGSFGLVDAYLQAGDTYFLVVKGATRHDSGDYKLKVIYREEPADLYEDDELPAGATELAFGPSGTQLRSAGKGDRDYVRFVLPAVGGLTGDVAYAFTATKPSGSVRDPTLMLDIVRGVDPQTGNGGTTYGYLTGQFPVLLRNLAIYANGEPPVTDFYLVVDNQSPWSGYFQETGAYELAVRAGPDYWDYDFNTWSPRDSATRDDARASVVTDSIAIGGPASMHTIWPAGDVDWVRVYWGSASNLTFHVTQPTGADDLNVEVSVYRGAETSPIASYESYYGQGDDTLESYFYPGTPGYLYFRIARTGYEIDKLTGAYAISVTSP